MAAFRPTPSLSVYPNPAAGCLMAILRAYFDDSKDDRILTIAGYLSDLESWGRFDRAWKAVLDKFGVPYLHIREFGEPDGIYRHIQDRPEEEAAFFAALVGVVNDHARDCIQTTVLLDDLKRFNKKHSFKLSAPALAICGCLLMLQRQFRGRPIEVVFDKFEKASSLIELGKYYAEADQHEPLNASLMLATRIEAEESWRTILPLQAADFVAWEMRKYCSDPSTWISGIRFEDVPSGAAIRDFGKWWTQFVKQEGRIPRLRKSWAALKECRARPNGFLINYAGLEFLQERHPYGWRLTQAHSKNEG